MNKRLIAILFLPVLLFAWGNDITITMNRDTLPASYDIAIPNQYTTLFVKRVRYSPENLTRESVFISKDSCKTWQHIYTYQTITPTLTNRVSIDFLNDSMVLYFPEYNSCKVILTSFNTDTDSVFIYSISLPLDTVMGQMLKIERNSLHFYISAIGKSQDTTIFVLKRSDDNGSSWHTVLYRPITSSQDINLTLLDFDANARTYDSVYITYLLSYHNKTNDARYIYYETLLDIMNTTPALIKPLTPIKHINSWYDASVSYIKDTLLCAILDTGILYFGYSTTPEDTIHIFEYPFMGDFDNIYSISMTRWIDQFSAGCDVAFVGSYGGISHIFYQKVTLTDSFPYFSPPIQVSDSPIYTYYLNPSPYYTPRIKNRYNLLYPSIVWHRDYASISGDPPLFLYDSTRFYIDFLSNVGINMNRNNNYPTPLSISIKGTRLVASSPFLDNTVNLRIINLEGRIVLDRVIQSNKNSIQLDISRLKNSVYFILIQTKDNTVLKGKFAKIR